MRINEVDVRTAKNSLVVVGNVSEYDIKVVDCIRECNIDGEPRKVNSAWIGGNMTVNVNGDDIKLSFKYNDTIRHKKNGDPNKSFASILTAFGYEAVYDEASKKLVYNKLDRQLTPRVEGKITIGGNTNIVKGGTPTRVKVSGKLGVTESLNKDQSGLSFYNELPVSFITTNATDEDSALFNIEGVIKTITNELNLSGEETGRCLLELVTPNFFDVDVFNFVVQDKWTNIIDGEEYEYTKEDFMSFAEIGDTCVLSGKIKGTTFGNVETTTPTTKKAFGGGARVNKSGFTRIEWIIDGGEEAEESYDNEIISLALEEREIKLDKVYQDKLEYFKNNSKSNDNAQKVEAPKATSNPFGAAKANPFGNGGAAKKTNPFQ